MSKVLKLQTEESSPSKFQTPKQPLGSNNMKRQSTNEKDKEDKDAFSSIYSPKSGIISEDTFTDANDKLRDEEIKPEIELKK